MLHLFWFLHSKKRKSIKTGVPKFFETVWLELTPSFFSLNRKQSNSLLQLVTGHCIELTYIMSSPHLSLPLSLSSTIANTHTHTYLCTCTRNCTHIHIQLRRFSQSSTHSHYLSLSLYLLSIFNWIHWNPKTWTQKRQIGAESVETEIAGNEVFDRSLNGGDKKESGSDVEPRKTPYSRSKWL